MHIIETDAVINQASMQMIPASSVIRFFCNMFDIAGVYNHIIMPEPGNLLFYPT